MACRQLPVIGMQKGFRVKGLTGLLARMARAMYQPFCSTDVLSPTAMSTSADSAPRPSARLCTMYRLRSASPPPGRAVRSSHPL